MNEYFMKPLIRKGFFYMSEQTVHQMQTGAYIIKDDRGNDKVQVLPKHYNGTFFDELKIHGIQWKWYGKILKLQVKHGTPRP